MVHEQTNISYITGPNTSVLFYFPYDFLFFHCSSVTPRKIERLITTHLINSKLLFFLEGIIILHGAFRKILKISLRGRKFARCGVEILNSCQ